MERMHALLTRKLQGKIMLSCPQVVCLGNLFRFALPAQQKVLMKTHPAKSANPGLEVRRATKNGRHS